MNREPGPKFEYRVWQDAADMVGERIARRARVAGEGTDLEVHLLLPSKPSTDIKIRDGRVEMKRRIEIVGGLERWKSVFAGCFPLDMATLPRGRTPLLGGDRGNLASLEDLIEAIRVRNPGAGPVRVTRRTRLFNLDGCKAEIDQVETLGRELRSAALEHASADVLLDVVRRLGAQGFWNGGYPQALLAVSEQETGSEPCAGKAIASLA